MCSRVCHGVKSPREHNSLWRVEPYTKQTNGGAAAAVMMMVMKISKKKSAAANRFPIDKSLCVQ